VVDGIGDDVFLPMMFYDACFLVQYMLTCTDAGLAHMDPALRSFFDANDNDVYHDIMQLENQLPWPVVRAVMRFRPVPLKEFVASLRGCLQQGSGIRPEWAEFHRNSPISVGPETTLNRPKKIRPILNL
jgi:hypothetical protein